MRKRTRKIFTRYVFLIAVAMFAVIYYALCVRTTIRESVMFSINSGDSVTSVARRLNNEEIIFSDVAFKMAIRLQGGRVQVGEYEIPRGASVWMIANMLTHGKVATTTVVIPEGLTILQIKDLLRGVQNLTGDVDCDDGRPVCDLADGDIFPDTYYVARGTSRLAVLELARKNMESIKNKWMRLRRNPPAPLSGWDDLITLASIVQRETPRASEMPIVASVYLNRLRRGMRLQADPTVVYVLTDGYGDMRGEPLLRGHLKIDSPYNTYRNKGLPPAPIANVGRAAIRAVMKPADTNYLYFVADGQGGHKFSTDYESHMKHHADWREIKKLNNPELESVNY